MSRRMNAKEFAKVRTRLAESEWRGRHNNEVALANAILQEFPSMTRSDALREADRILRERKQG